MKALSRILQNSFLLFLILLTWVIAIYHRGVLSPSYLVRDRAPVDVAKIGQFIPKTKFGVHQLILKGSDYERGVASGALTSDLMYHEEAALSQKLNEFFPSAWLRRAFEVAGIRWFWGIDNYFEPRVMDEMYGVSKAASPDFDYLIDGFTRQLVYHGLHEVGQMFVDAGREEGFGCTVFAVPQDGSWILGRNFDFESGRIFDEDKIMKWVFPDEGNAFVSVIWAGMVGAVTGVNEKGVYLNINAAGSNVYRRMGTPSTLVLLKALQFANTAAEAVALMEKEQMFITDIFVVADRNEVYRVEKSPTLTRAEKLTGPSVVTNHLQSADWEKDPVNVKRMEQQTTMQRYQRGQVLLSTLRKDATSSETESNILAFLRDKKDVEGKPLALGNRMAIDALIATHSAIYNAAEQTFYVSEGPAISGPFVGFDLKASFAERSPVYKKTLPGDPEVSKSKYFAVKETLEKVNLAQRKIKHLECDEAGDILNQLVAPNREHSSYYTTLGNWYECKNDLKHARGAWKTAMALKPAYKHERDYLLSKLAQ